MKQKYFNKINTLNCLSYNYIKYLVLLSYILNYFNTSVFITFRTSFDFYFTKKEKNFFYIFYLLQVYNFP